MSIRLKLLLSYIAMLVIPLIVTLITASLLTVVFRGDFESIREQYNTHEEMFNIHAVKRVFKEMERNARNNPSLLEDTGYLDEIAQELRLYQSYLLIRKGDSFLYVSPELAALQASGALESLPRFEHPGSTERESPERYGKRLYEILQADFMSADRQDGSLLILTEVNPIVNFARKFFPILFWALIVFLVITNSLLTYFMSRSIIKPLSQLKKAMKRIEAGDLDCRVEIAGKDEIGQLAAAFEQMRVQLKHSIATQLQFEENRKELVSNISHDLRTPLTAIKGYVDGLGDGVADTPDKQQKYLDIIALKAEEMDHLIDELFLYSRLDLNRLPFHFELVDMNAFILDWSDELEFELAKQDVRYRPDILLPAETMAMIDRDKIRRVFSNVLGNALKYLNKPEKSIRLQALRQEAQVIIRITDNGQGINPEALPHIFERFYREDPSRNSHTGGSGLGLAISKQIVEGHGGTIQAQSVKGEGTSIEIALPIAKKDGDPK